MKVQDVLPIVLSIALIILVAILERQSRLIAAVTAVMPLGATLAYWIVYSANEGEPATMEPFSRGLVLGPGGGEHAGVLGRIGVADHDHQAAVDVAAVPVALQQALHHRPGAGEVVQGFEQRRHRQGVGAARLLEQQVHGQHVGRLARHGNHVGAQRLRRLAERGVRFIQLFHRGWDQHGSLPSDIRLQCGDTDQPSAALVEEGGRSTEIR